MTIRSTRWEPWPWRRSLAPPASTPNATSSSEIARPPPPLEPLIGHWFPTGTLSWTLPGSTPCAARAAPQTLIGTADRRKRPWSHPPHITYGCDTSVPVFVYCHVRRRDSIMRGDASLYFSDRLPYNHTLKLRNLNIYEESCVDAYSGASVAVRAMESRGGNAEKCALTNSHAFFEWSIRFRYVIPTPI
ncbi:uncharacterized protein BCR38DRAFT_414411 [Pseudomassariella vexata]|uniref:Uncharacterized protein n=1 Tax=Pseudomassariella vexata TaxID=1141098 RepID=A0A1Y2DBL8_9PEZI|nr:uncharacterized protein BCR38DRAFT_414411 [Pseudomassariella vexata]ORY56660.1 hypothetical protein BCR38DRAFT_414411 [Pseudomassariella vexata]